jgi:hypothetical protein
VPRLWELIHRNGYTPGVTTVTVRGDLVNGNGRLQLQVSGTQDALALVANQKNASAYGEVPGKIGRNVIV